VSGGAALPVAARSPFLAVVLLQVGLFVAAPFLVPVSWGPGVITAGGCLMLALAVRASDCRAITKRLSVTAAAAIVGLDLVASRIGSDPLDAVARLLFLALVAVAGAVVLRTILRAREIDAGEIYAAVCFYLMLGVWWAAAYAFFDWLDLVPAAFSHDVISRGTPGASQTGAFGELLYYSYVTLTTVGYGDVVPTHPITRNLAAFEAITGQLYLAVLLARLVALYTMRPRRR